MIRLRTRTAFLCAALVGGCLAVAAFAVLPFLERVQTSTTRRLLTGEAVACSRQLARLFRASAGQPSAAAAARVLQSLALPAEQQVVVQHADGRVWLRLPAPSAAPGRERLPSAGEGQGVAYGQGIGKGTWFQYPESVVAVQVPVRADGRIQGWVTVAAPLRPANVNLLAMWGEYTAALAAIGIAALPAIRLLTRHLSRPVEQAAAAANRLAAGEPGPRPWPDGVAEVEQLSHALGTLADRLAMQTEELEEAKSKLDGVIANMGSGVILVDRAGRITLVNDAATRLLGGLQSGHDHREALAWPELSALVDHALSRGEPAHAELCGTRSGGLTLDVHAAPARGRHRSVAGVVVVLHDVSAWRRVVEMRSEFVANVSHELRSPITAIQGFAETLLDGAIDDPEASRQFLQVIYDESVRIGRLVEDLLDLSKMESGHTVFHFEPHDLRDLIQQVSDRFRHQADKLGISLVTAIPDTPVLAEVARERVLQVLVNLVANALAYTPSGGIVTLAVEDGGKEVRLIVRDTGIGIPPADLPHIFERFYRVDKARSRQSGGTGLGLSIVRHIVEAHGGRIDVHSRLGAGSTFTVVLPKHRPLSA
ncbi:MAG: PAS domain-containing protein [Alicyclobacillaceae bacterium]|nr:PAS domain-containing protein [Alicyclobacillaceae bacterium]